MEAQRGAQLAVDVINGLNPSIPLPLAADAGLPNLGGAKVSLVVENATPDNATTNGSQVAAGTAVTKLVSDDGAQALIGAYDPQVTEYASQRSERYEVPFVNADSPATFLTDAGRDWFFRIGPSWRSSGEAFFSLLKDQKERPGKVEVLYANDKAGQDVVTTIGELATRPASRGRRRSASPRTAATSRPRSTRFARTTRRPSSCTSPRRPCSPCCRRSQPAVQAQGRDVLLARLPDRGRVHLAGRDRGRPAPLGVLVDRVGRAQPGRPSGDRALPAAVQQPDDRGRGLGVHRGDDRGPGHQQRGHARTTSGSAARCSA